MIDATHSTVLTRIYSRVSGPEIHTNVQITANICVSGIEAATASATSVMERCDCCANVSNNTQYQDNLRRLNMLSVSLSQATVKLCPV